MLIYSDIDGVCIHIDNRYQQGNTYSERVIDVYSIEHIQYTRHLPEK